MITFLIMFSLFFIGGGYLMFFASTAAVTFSKIVFLFFSSMLGATVFGLFLSFIIKEIINITKKRTGIFTWKKETKTIIPYHEHSEEEEHRDRGRYYNKGKILFMTDSNYIYLWVKEGDEIKEEKINSRESIEIYQVEKGDITHNKLVIKRPVLHVGLWSLSFGGRSKYIIYTT